MRSRFVRVATAAVVACLALGLVAVTAASAAARGGGKGGAMAEAESLGVRPGSLVRKETFDGKTVCADERSGTEVILDEEEGFVAAFADARVIGQMYERSGDEPLLGEKRLLGIARSYVARTIPRWGSVSDASIEVSPLFFRADGGPAAYQAVVIVRKRYRGLRTSDGLTLTMDPVTGEVASLRQSRGRTDVDPVPRLSENEAEEIAVRHVKDPNGVVRRTDAPSVWRDPKTRRAHLVMWVEVQGTPSVGGGGDPLGKRVVAVDLHTGEIRADVQ